MKPRKLKMAVIIVIMVLGIFELLFSKISAFTQVTNPDGTQSWEATGDTWQPGYEYVQNNGPMGMTLFCQEHGGYIDFKGSKEGWNAIERINYFETHRDYYPTYDEETGEWDDYGRSEIHSDDANYAAYLALKEKLMSEPVATFIRWTPVQRTSEDVSNELAYIVSSGGSIPDVQEAIWGYLNDPKNQDFANKNHQFATSAIKNDVMNKVADAYDAYKNFINNPGGFPESINAWNYNKVTGETSHKHMEISSEGESKKFTYTDTQIAVDKSNGEEYILRTILCRLLSRRNCSAGSRIPISYKIL